MALAEEDWAAMKQLTLLRPLHKRLARLRRRRQRFRWATAASAVAIAVLWALAGVFALDWCFQRNIDLWQRLLLLATRRGGRDLGLHGFALPWLGKHEDETEMALLVQRQSGIDSDLVAALQFELPEAPRWGSAQLETAVIDRVAARQQKINVMAAMPHQPLSRRLKVLLATLAVWAVLGVARAGIRGGLLPAAGVRRAALSGADRSWPPSGSTARSRSVGARRGAMHVPYGQAVRFEVIATGRSPNRAAWRFFPGSRPRRDRAAGAAGGRRRIAVGVPGPICRLNQSARYKVYLGDAWTDRSCSV